MVYEKPLGTFRGSKSSGVSPIVGSFWVEIPGDLARLMMVHFLTKSLTMFNQIKLAVLILLTLFTIVGCASIGQAPNSYPVNIENSLRDIAYASVETYPTNIELPTPILEVQDAPIPLKELHQKARIVMSEAEINCLARNIYFEARGEGLVGMTAVGYVTLNRMGHPKFPDTACAVVFDRKFGCQFSWTCDGMSDNPRSRVEYEIARYVAVSVMEGSLPNPIDDSVFFRAGRAVSNRYQVLRTRIGAHSFLALI